MSKPNVLHTVRDDATPGWFAEVAHGDILQELDRKTGEWADRFVVENESDAWIAGDLVWRTAGERYRTARVDPACPPRREIIFG